MRFHKLFICLTILFSASVFAADDNKKKAPATAVTTQIPVIPESLLVQYWKLNTELLSSQIIYEHNRSKVEQITNVVRQACGPKHVLTSDQQNNLSCVPLPEPKPATSPAPAPSTKE